MFEAVCRALGTAPTPRAAPAAIDRALGALLYWRGDMSGAEAALRRATRAYRARRDPAGVGRSLVALGYVVWMRGEVPRAERYFAQSLKLAEAAGDEDGRARPLNGLAVCARLAGDYERAIRLHEQSAGRCCGTDLEETRHEQRDFALPCPDGCAFRERALDHRLPPDEHRGPPRLCRQGVRLRRRGDAAVREPAQAPETRCTAARPRRRTTSCRAT
jgi:hypothetical protein